MINFAFVHCEKQYTIMGKMLTYSIKKIYPNSSVIDVRGRGQPVIENTDYSEIWDFPEGNIMYDDVAAKVFVQEKYGPTLFIDTDMLLLKKIDNFIEIGNFDISVTKRTEKSMLKVLNYESHKDRFPDLVNKTLGETMPFNAGIYFCKNLNTIKYMLSTFDKMNKEYFVWYGNQVALNEMIRSKIFKIKIFDSLVYNYTPLNSDEDFSMRSILHFKGSKRHLYIPVFKKIFGENELKKLFK